MSYFNLVFFLYHVFSIVSITTVLAMKPDSTIYAKYVTNKIVSDKCCIVSRFNEEITNVSV